MTRETSPARELKAITPEQNAHLDERTFFIQVKIKEVAEHVSWSPHSNASTFEIHPKADV